MNGRPNSAPQPAPTGARRPFGPLAAVAVAIVLLSVLGVAGTTHTLGAVRSPLAVGGGQIRADSIDLTASSTGSLTPTAVISLPSVLQTQTETSGHEDPGTGSTGSTATGPIAATAASGSKSYSPLQGLYGIDGSVSACFQPAYGVSTSPLGCLPPDVTMSASPNFVVEENNVAGEIWTSAGAKVSFFTLTNFYTAPSGAGCYLSDPQVYYDAANGGHWFSSILSVTGCGGGTAESTVYLAVSVTNDPTGPWYEYVIPNAVTGDLSDQPVMGVNNNVVVISTNEFPYPALAVNAYTGALFYVLNKLQLEQAGCTLPVTLCLTPVAYNTYGPYSAMASIHPAHSYGNAPVEYMASANAFGAGQGGTNVLNFVAVSGAPGTVGGVSVSQTDLSILPTTGPPLGMQPGYNLDTCGTLANQPCPVNTDDSRIQAGVYQNGVSWWGATDGCTVAGALHACLRLIEVTTSSGYAVHQDFDYTTSTSKAPVQDDYYPGLTLTPTGILAVSFAYSSSAVYPSMAVTVQGKAGTLEPATTVAAGQDNELGGRYGDYCDASPSYSSSSNVWLACEYILNYNSYTWNTHVEEIGA